MGSSAITSSEDVQLVGDTGPGPDGPGAPSPAAEQAAAQQAAAPATEQLAGVIAWEEEKLRDVMRVIGDGAHAIAGVAESDWAFIDADLDRIVPPLTRIMNRVPVLAKASEASDPLAVGIGFGLYGWRSAWERAAALKDQERKPRAASPAPPPTAARQPPRPAPAPMAAPSVNVNGGPAVADGYVTNADRLRATRPPDEESDGR